MKVYKIDIKKELMEVPERSAHHFVDYNNYRPAMLIKEGEQMPSFVTCEDKIETYLVTPVKKPDGRIEDYLVKTDERDIFNELITVSNETVEKEVEKRTKKKEMMFLYEKQKLTRMIQQLLDDRERFEHFAEQRVQEQYDKMSTWDFLKKKFST